VFILFPKNLIVYLRDVIGSVDFLCIIFFCRLFVNYVIELGSGTGVRSGVIPVQESATRGNGVFGPDFWSWTPPVESDVPSDEDSVQLCPMQLWRRSGLRNFSLFHLRVYFLKDNRVTLFHHFSHF